MSKLLLDETPLVILPSLACAVGVNEAIVLQQLHYWLQRSSNEKDGRTWVYNTVEEWQAQFPFWSRDQVRRTLDSLRAQGVVLAANLNTSGYNRRLWYAIDYDRVTELAGAIWQEREMHLADLPNGFGTDAKSNGQDCQMDLAPLPNHIGTETTTETTQETTQTRAAPPKRTPVEVYAELAKRKPNPTQADMIDYEVRDVARWEQVVRAWLGRDYKASNVDGMLTVYRDGWRENGRAAVAKAEEPAPFGSGQKWLVENGYLSSIIMAPRVMSADEITF